MNFYESATIIKSLNRIAAALEKHTEIMQQHTEQWKQSLALSAANLNLSSEMFERQKSTTVLVSELQRLHELKSKKDGQDSESQLSQSGDSASEQV